MVFLFITFVIFKIFALKAMAANENNFPHEIVDVEPNLARKLMEQFTGEHTGFVRVGPKGYFLPHKYRQEATRIYNMPLRPDDVFVASYPRSGLTWTQELVWLVLEDLDYVGSDAEPLLKRYRFLESTILFHPVLQERLKSVNSNASEKLAFLEHMFQPVTEHLARSTSQRFIKTRLPLSLLPPKVLDTAKMVYVARDPRDVAVSFYYVNNQDKRFRYVGDFKTYWKYFIKNLSYWSPYFEHLKEAWEMRHHPNMLFLFYEDMSKDLPASVRRVAAFFNKDFTEEQIAKMCKHLSFENFKNNKSVNFSVLKQFGLLNDNDFSFIRKGKVGGWREYFDAEMSQEADNWIAENLKDTDFRFPHLETL